MSAQTGAAKNRIGTEEIASNLQQIRRLRNLKSSDTISLRIVLHDWAEEGSLVCDLGAVADQDDLLVG